MCNILRISKATFVQSAWILIFLTTQQFAFSESNERPVTEVDTKKVAQVLGYWRNLLSGSSAKYRVTEEAFDVPQKDSEGHLNLTKPKIKSCVSMANVWLQITDDAILERSKFLSLSNDGNSSTLKNSSETQEVSLLLKDGATTLYYPGDKYVWIQDGAHFVIPFIGQNYDKLILISGFVKDFLDDASDVKINVDDNACSITSSKGELLIETHGGIPSSLTATYPYQINKLNFKFDTESKLPRKISFEVRARAVDKLLMRAEWLREEANTIPASTNLVLSIPRYVQIDDDRIPK